MIAQNRIKKSNPYSLSTNGCLSLENTTDLTAIGNRKVLVLLDEQNLSITAKKLGFRLRYDLLTKRIRREAGSAKLHIFVASEPRGNGIIGQFKKVGYVVHVKTIRRKLLPNGRLTCDSNVDNLFAFWAGVYISRATFDVVVLGSGDYGVAGELSEAINRYRRKPIEILTLSLPTSTSEDLDARINPNITANLEIGLDLLKPSVHTRCQLAAAAASSFGKFRFGNFINPLL